MNTFISFIGSNDAGKLIGNEDEGAILTILKERKFDSIYLLYNTNGKAEVKDKIINYKDISEYIKTEIINNKYCKSSNIIIKNFDLNDITDHAEIYNKLLNYLDVTFPSDILDKSEIYAGISSGTPAMHSAWTLLAESDSFPIKLIRSVEKRHSKNGKRIFDVELLTGTKEKLEQLRHYENRLGIKSKSNYYIVEDTLHLNEKQIQIAKSDKHILIFGETGVGKEVFAKTLHDFSERNKYEFIPLNCAGLPEHLLESELFGHVKGAFTGAFYNKRGIVDEYSNGTLFLDEVNSLPITIQSKLLRFLESGEYRRLGSNKTEKSNIRILSASNENIQKLVSEGKFREDLYYRLRTFEFYLPPLRERKEIIPSLVKNINKELEISNDALNLLQSHNYKGNIRELKIILERLSIHITSNKVNLKDVENVLNQIKSENNFSEIDIPKEISGKAFKLVRQILTNAALSQTNNNASAAAKLLGVTHPVIPKWAKGED